MSNFEDWVNKNYPELLKNQGTTLAMCMSFAKEGYEAGQQSKQEDVDKLERALNYILEQLDHPYRASGEAIEIQVKKILNE